MTLTPKSTKPTTTEDAIARTDRYLAATDAAMRGEYGPDSPLVIPVEIRFTFVQGKGLTLTATRHDTGLISYILRATDGNGPDESLSTFQGSTAALPRKAVAGWQAEVVAFAHGVRIGKVAEIR